MADLKSSLSLQVSCCMDNIGRLHADSNLELRGEFTTGNRNWKSST